MVLPAGMAREAAGSSPGLAALKGLWEAKAEPEGLLLWQGRRAEPRAPEDLLGPLQALR